MEAANGFKLEVSGVLRQNPTPYMLIIQTEKVYTSSNWLLSFYVAKYYSNLQNRLIQGNAILFIYILQIMIT